VDIDGMLLIHCKPENVERLARALKMPLPLPGPQYERRLRRALVAALETDRRRAAAEEQRMKDKAEALKVAAEIAQAIGETGERPIAQIRRIVVLMGAEWARERLDEAERWHLTGPCRRSDGVARTYGGVFFEVCRRAASGHVVPGGISRREFFRCFFDRPKKPRPAPALKEVRPGGKKARKDVTHNWGAPKLHDRRARDPHPVEVYVSPRRRA
jgi:hypothetical protein